jgi:hypothetical protein
MSINNVAQPVAYEIRALDDSFYCLSREKSKVRGVKSIPLYTAPPAQTPPRLSDEQISDIAVSTPPNVHTYGRAIETAVRRQFGVQE